ncbi:MAG: hypothetical protein ACOY5Y_01985 [Pseudomonadota bacterium]|jgi:hypothetical protein
MRRPVPPTEDLVLRLGAGLIGAVSIVSAVLAAELARQHMALLGTICGAGPHPHCGWCYGAASLVLVGLAAFAYAARPVRNGGLLQIKAELPRA